MSGKGASPPRIVPLIVPLSTKSPQVRALKGASGSVSDGEYPTVPSAGACARKGTTVLVVPLRAETPAEVLVRSPAIVLAETLPAAPPRGAFH